MEVTLTQDHVDKAAAIRKAKGVEWSSSAECPVCVMLREHTGSDDVHAGFFCAGVDDKTYIMPPEIADLLGAFIFELPLPVELPHTFELEPLVCE